MAGLDLTTFSAVLKSLYSDQGIQDLTLKDNPFWAKLRKVGDFYGQNLVVPMRYADPETSRSRTFSKALNARTNSASRYAKCTVTRGHEYGTLTIDRETMAASENNKGAFLEARKAEIDGMINAIGRSIGIGLFRDGSGVRGRISTTSNVATSTITLAEPNDVSNFEYGQALVAFQTMPSPGVVPTLRNAGATPAYVVGIDRDLGTITVSGTVGGAPAAWNSLIAAIAPGDYLMVDGDNVGFSSTSNSSAIAGLGAWLPETPPAPGENFFGLDRSTDASRLGGVRFQATGLPLSEGLIKCASRVARDGGNPDAAYMSFNQFSNIVTDLGSKARYTEFRTGTIGFQALKLYGPRGEIDIFADPNCPNDKVYLLDSSTWAFHHLRAAPHLVVDGNVNGLMQEANADAVQVRVVCWGQLTCTAPGKNAVMTVDT